MENERKRELSQESEGKITGEYLWYRLGRHISSARNTNHVDLVSNLKLGFQNPSVPTFLKGG